MILWIPCVFPCMDAMASVTLLLVGKVNNVTKMEIKLRFLMQYLGTIIKFYTKRFSK